MQNFKAHSQNHSLTCSLTLAHSHTLSLSNTQHVKSQGRFSSQFIFIRVNGCVNIEIGNIFVVADWASIYIDRQNKRKETLPFCCCQINRRAKIRVKGMKYFNLSTSICNTTTIVSLLFDQINTTHSCPNCWIFRGLRVNTVRIVFWFGHLIFVGGKNKKCTCKINAKKNNNNNKTCHLSLPTWTAVKRRGVQQGRETRVYPTSWNGEGFPVRHIRFDFRS